MIAYFANDSFLGSHDSAYPLPSYHFFCPSCGMIWARIVCEPGDYHRVCDTVWCAVCARTNEHGIWDGVIDVPCFPEFSDFAPTAVLVHNFMQLYDNRVRLDNAEVRVKSSIKYWPNNSELLDRLKESA